jgi:hypothetical protein
MRNSHTGYRPAKIPELIINIKCARVWVQGGKNTQAEYDRAHTIVHDGPPHPVTFGAIIRSFLRAWAFV